jgi:hypothetical protein
MQNATLDSDNYISIEVCRPGNGWKPAIDREMGQWRIAPGIKNNGNLVFLNYTKLSPGLNIL